MSKWKKRLRVLDQFDAAALRAKGRQIASLNTEIGQYRATIAHIRQVARATPNPTVADVCVFCQHNPQGLHAPGCAWNELLKAIGVANEETVP